MVAPDGVYDAAAAWASRFVDAPRSALAAAKAGLDDVYRVAPAERWDAERRRYLEVFDAMRRSSVKEWDFLKTPEKSRQIERRVLLPDQTSGAMLDWTRHRARYHCR